MFPMAEGLDSGQNFGMCVHIRGERPFLLPCPQVLPFPRKTPIPFHHLL